MIHGQHLNKTVYQTPLFKNCSRAQPSSQTVPTWYLMLSNQQADMRLHNYNLCKYLCPIFSNETDNCCFIVMEGDDLDTFIHAKLADDSPPLLTEEEIWTLIICISEALAYLKQHQCEHLLTHFKQYSIRRIPQKKLFKLVFHSSMISQLNAAKSGVKPWNYFYLSPEELNADFMPEKSIVFSFGSLLLHLCAFQDRNTSLYASDRFAVDTKIIEQKIKISLQNGYSKLLCNFIQDCLTLDHDQRFGFYQLKEAAKRKMERQYNKQSELLSQMVSLEKGQSISYEISMPAKYQFSTKSPAHHKHIRTKSQQMAGQEQQIFEQETKLQQSSVDFTGNVAIEQASKKKKKKVKSKFEGSKVGHSKYQNNSDNGNLQLEEVNKIVPPIFDYRGTFGARNVSIPDQNEGRRIKNSKMLSEDSQQEQRQPYPNPSSAQKQPESASKNAADTSNSSLDSSEKRNKIKNIKVQIPQKKDKANEDNSQPEEVQTPKGFGRNLSKRKIVQQSNIRFEQMANVIKFPDLMTEMDHLTLEQCLKPVEEIAKSIGKIGVWVQGDLYFGDFTHGRRDGLALQIFSNGEYYYGFFKEDLFFGQGFYFWNSREYFFGKFELGQKVYGRLEGEVQYQGGFKENKRSGFGTCWYSTGQIYSGDWLNGKKHGRGLLLEPDGSKFFGNWVRGKRKGEGYLETQLMKIKGSWDGESIEGQAQIEYKNGDVFEGRVGKTLQKMHGKYISKSGRVFAGDFENDMPRKGELVYSNGDKYIGQLVNLRRHGYGQYYYTTGQVYKGQWENNAKKQ